MSSGYLPSDADAEKGRKIWGRWRGKGGMGMDNLRNHANNQLEMEKLPLKSCSGGAGKSRKNGKN